MKNAFIKGFQVNRAIANAGTEVQFHNFEENRQKLQELTDKKENRPQENLTHTERAAERLGELTGLWSTIVFNTLRHALDPNVPSEIEIKVPRPLLDEKKINT